MPDTIKTDTGQKRCIQEKSIPKMRENHTLMAHNRPKRWQNLTNWQTFPFWHALCSNKGDIARCQNEIR